MTLNHLRKRYSHSLSGTHPGTKNKDKFEEKVKQKIVIIRIRSKQTSKRVYIEVSSLHKSVLNQILFEKIFKVKNRRRLKILKRVGRISDIYIICSLRIIFKMDFL